MSAQLGIVITARDLSSGVLKGIGDAGEGMGSRIAGAGKVMAIGLAAGATALAGLTAFSIKAASDAESIAKATDAVLASTQGVAGMTSEAVAGLATSLSLVAPFEDEAIQGAENLLLTFTNIGKDIFPTATETVLNMSQALGQDLKSSSIQLGKALQDPVAGVTALRRVGVMLTDDQQALIESLVASGDTMAAQKIILGELETEFGGAAKAAGQTFAGQLTIAQTQLGNVAEMIGGALLPAITPLISAFSQSLPGAMEALKPGLASVGEMVKKLATSDFKGAFNDMMGIVGDVGGQLATTLLDWGRQLWAWIEPMIPPLLVKLGQLARDLLGWIGEQVGPLLAKLGEWGRQLWAWIEPMIGPMLTKAGELAGRLWGWIAAEAPGLAHKFLSDWLPAAIEWVVKAAVDILPKLALLIAGIGLWIITTGIPELVKFGLSMAGGILSGIGEGVGKLAGKLGEWIGEQLRKIKIDVGPFHLSSSGFSVDVPSMPSISLPGFGGGGGGGVGAHEPGGAIYEAWKASGSPDYNTIAAAIGGSFASGGIVPGAIGAPMLAVVHGGERITPNGGGIDYDRLARVMAARPVVLQVDGQTIARVLTTEQSYARTIG